MIRFDKRNCPHCGENHTDLIATRRTKPGEDGSTHEGKCPSTQKPLPVWHSGHAKEEPDEQPAGQD